MNASQPIAGTNAAKSARTMMLVVNRDPDPSPAGAYCEAMRPSQSDALQVARSLGLDAREATRSAEGSEHLATFDLDDSFILRIALTSRGDSDLAREQAVLLAVAALVDLEIPTRFATGRRDGRPVAAYRKIRGISGEELRPDADAWPALAAQLGSFLSRIHVIDPTGMPDAELDEIPKDLSRFGSVIL